MEEALILVQFECTIHQGSRDLRQLFPQICIQRRWVLILGFIPPLLSVQHPSPQSGTPTFRVNFAPQLTIPRKSHMDMPRDHRYQGFYTRVVISIDISSSTPELWSVWTPGVYTGVTSSIDTRSFYTRIKNSEEFMLGQGHLCPYIMKPNQNNKLKTNKHNK